MPAPDCQRPVAMCGRRDLLPLLRHIQDKRVTLMGLGLFGGGEGAARYLLERGAHVLVTDLRPAEKLAEPMGRLADLSPAYRLGEHREEDFARADLIVANPAVPRANAYLHAAQAAGVPITSPMSMFLALCPASVAAVTGSNGKSTTTALLGRMVECSGPRTFVGGNIGVSLMDRLDEMRADDVVVLELSSFQLSDAAALEWSPHVAVVTNLAPNHLNWHADMEDYVESKRTIVRFQGAGDFAVLNGGDAVLRGWAAERLPGRVLFFSSAPDPLALDDGMNLMADRLVWHEGGRYELVCARDEIPLPGMHNVENVMAAAAAARCLGADTRAVREALSSFVGLEHRLEPVGEYRGIRFYNDSDSTTAESTVAAVRSFQGSVTLIAGGSDKKLDLTPIGRAAAECANVLITMGQTGPRIAEAARRHSLVAGSHLLVREVQTLDEAVQAAAELAMPGSVVVFSPGCASFDMFENFRHRGETFKQLVRTHFQRRRERA